MKVVVITCTIQTFNTSPPTVIFSTATLPLLLAYSQRSCVLHYGMEMLRVKLIVLFKAGYICNSCSPSLGYFSCLLFMQTKATTGPQRQQIQATTWMRNNQQVPNYLALLTRYATYFSHSSSTLVCTQVRQSTRPALVPRTQRMTPSPSALIQPLLSLPAFVSTIPLECCT